MEAGREERERDALIHELPEERSVSVSYCATIKASSSTNEGSTVSEPHEHQVISIIYFDPPITLNHNPNKPFVREKCD